MFAGIFTIGLFFSVLFWRSGNLWLVGILHGLGDAYMDGLRVILS
jgi:membrane protease YdiL (CAAX protease family)